MKALILPPSLASLLALLPAAAQAAPLAGALSAAAPPAEPTSPSLQESKAEWLKSFNKARAVGATSEMEKLVKTNTKVAIEHVLETAEQFSILPSAELEELMTDLRMAWKGAIGSRFADEMYEYYSLLDRVYRDERTKFKRRYDKAYNRYRANQKQDPGVYGALAHEFETIAEAFREVGDFYWSSQSWLMAYSCSNQVVRGADADLYECCRILKNLIEQRKKVDLEDQVYRESSTAYASLKAQGYDRSETGEEGGGPGGAPEPEAKETGTAAQVALAFELVTEIDSFDRPTYYADELHNIWAQLFLRKKGSESKFSSLGDLSPKVTRTGSSEVLVDTDGDGTGDLSIPLRGNLDPIEFEIGQGAERRKWGVLTKIGTNNDMYQQIQVNMTPNDDQMQIYLVPGASMVGELEGVELRVIDENMDGVYGSSPLNWEHVGLSQGQNHPEFDSILVGGAKRARPWSEYQQIGEAWYRLEVVNGGTSLKAYPVELETGDVKVSSKGVKPNWLVAQGTGRYENSYFDLMEKGVELPVGTYKLFCGEVRKGKKQQTMKALILPGKSMGVWRVNAGESTKVELGAPFSFDFEFDEGADSITIPGKSVVVTGVAGERYERLWNCVARPEASYRAPGSKKGSKAEDFKVVSTQEEINAAGDWSVAWFPADLTLVKRGGLEKSEVQLQEKKNKLFGKIVSDWKK